ncbi:MAG: polysaccharide deacetylase family protein [Saccharospirillum sp.]|nr:polysaccharide deacetylase family protein [Saccharospirillum sp.]
MNPIKQGLKWGYTQAAARLGAHRKHQAEPRLWVLMYHRILPKDDPRFALEEPGMLVTPATFSQHLEWVKQEFEVVDLQDWVRKAQQGEPLPNKACAITFDDGWRDNYEFALPLLREHQIPATLFAVADKIGSDFRFWPNIVSELVAARAPQLANHPYFQEAASLAERGFDREGIARVIAGLKQYSEVEIFAALEAIGWQQALAASEPPLMDWPQLLEMADSGWVTIGSHTCTHQRLDKGLDAAALAEEVEASRVKLEAWLQRPVPLFCFPNGDYDAAALGAVEKTYQAAVTTRKGINTAGQGNWHELLRIGLHEDGSGTKQRFLAKMAAW